MEKPHAPGRHLREAITLRSASLLAAVVCTLAFASALSAPAGALGAGAGTGFGPHASARTAPAAERAHDIAPLTLANFVVTDLATNNSSVYSWSSVTAVNNANSFCNVSTTSNLCVSYGTGSGPNGGEMDLSPQPGGAWQAGAIYDPIEWSLGNLGRRTNLPRGATAHGELGARSGPVHIHVWCSPEPGGAVRLHHQHDRHHRHHRLQHRADGSRRRLLRVRSRG